MCGDEAYDENKNANAERTPANPEKFIKVPLDDACSMREIPADGVAELPRGLCLSDIVGKMDDDPDRLIGGQFASPTNDEILRLAIEVALPKRKWIQCVKELRDLVDAELNYILDVSRCHCGSLSMERHRTALDPNQRHQAHKCVIFSSRQNCTMPATPHIEKHFTAYGY